jgi:recombination protein RecR
MDYIEPIERLADMFRRLDGIGKKTAVRLAFSVMELEDGEAKEFADAILSVKRDVCLCSLCQNISTDEVCELCSDGKRDHSVICVVEDSRAVTAIERSGGYTGLYHVLHGAISPMHGVGPDKLKIKELLSRLSDGSVKEVIIATNPTVEGEATAMYLSKLISPLGILISRIANGVPVGGDLEYADDITLRRAMDGRYDMNA